MKLLSRVVGIVLLCLSHSIMAGVVTLSNGDKVHGKFGSLNGETLIWESDLLGTLKIDKRKVVAIDSDQPLKIVATEQACLIQAGASVDLGKLKLDCAGEQKLIEINALQNVVTYQDHQTNGSTLSGKISLTGSNSQGNQDKQDWDFELEGHYDIADYRNSLTLSYDSTSVNDQAVDEKHEVKYALDWFFKERWYMFYDASYGADETRNIDTRWTLGLGLGYEFVGSENLSMSLSSGLNYVTEEFDAPEAVTGSFVDNDERFAWSFSTDLNYHLPLGVDLFHKNELLQSLEGQDDWQFESDTGLIFPLMGGISSEVKYEYDYDNMPQEGKVKDDGKVTIGLGYKW